MTALEEYEQHRHRIGTPETVHMVRGDLADAAIESLKCCGNCGHHADEKDYEDWWVRCQIHEDPGFVPEKGREYMPEKVNYDDRCHFAESRWQERTP
ncbi:MAG: hypothetical protein ABFE13_11925 [Phycisphaerales bacterium]